MECYMTELSIHEVGLSPAPDTFASQSNHRLECLCTCLHAIKSWADIFLGTSPAHYVGLSILTYTGLPRCLVGIHRLLTFEHPEWDKGLVREQGLNPFAFLEDLEKYFMCVREAAHLDPGASGEPDVYSLLSFKLRAMRAAWEGVVGPDISSHDVAPTMEICDFEMPLLDDEWLNYMFGPGTNSIFTQSTGV